MPDNERISNESYAYSREERAAKLANDILDFVNDFSSDHDTFVETICRGHRTLQQSTMRLFVRLAERMAKNDWDERNKQAVILAEMIAQVSEHCSLPLI